MNDKRRLRRIDNRYGQDLDAKIFLKDRKCFGASVLDYNSNGVRVHLKNDEQSDDLSSALHSDDTSIERIEIFFGTSKVGYFNNPVIVRYDLKDRTVALKFEHRKQKTRISRLPRLIAGTFHQGTLSGPDPFTLNQVIFFKVVEFSLSGLLVQSSKSNRHILIGMQFTGFDLVLPGVGATKINFTIRRAEVEGDAITFGISIDHVEKHFLKRLKAFLLASTICPDAQTVSLKGVSLEPHIRFRRIQSSLEYDMVLELRKVAYERAGKFTGSTAAEMADDFDKYAIIYGAFFNAKLVGTMRLVMGKGGPLPFEKHFDILDLKNVKRDVSAEISRLAIDPRFQGTDLFVIMFRNIIVEVGAKGVLHPFSLATNKLLSTYELAGARQLGRQVSHPTIAGETLHLIEFPRKVMINGNMNALGWFKIVSPSVRFLNRHGFIKKPAIGIFKLVTFPFDLIVYLVRRRKKSTSVPKNPSMKQAG